jgi:hydroxylamine reductase
VAQGEEHGLKSYPAPDADALSLKHTLLFGIKGVCAYADHAQILGQEDDKVYAFVHEGLAATAARRPGVPICSPGPQMRRDQPAGHGTAGRGQHRRYGHPVPTPVPLGPQKGQGHPGFRPRLLKDLEEILKQTEGKGINVYTHGEMLPCHGYPELKKIPPFLRPLRHRLAEPGKEFAQFPGPSS